MEIREESTPRAFVPAARALDIGRPISCGLQRRPCGGGGGGGFHLGAAQTGERRLSSCAKRARPFYKTKMSISVVQI